MPKLTAFSESSSELACSKGCGREFPNAGPKASHERSCDPERDSAICVAYVDRGESVDVVAARFGMSPARVREAIVRAGGSMRARGSRRPSESDDPAWPEPPLDGWQSTGVTPMSAKFAAGRCLLCLMKFSNPDALLDHLAGALEGGDGHYVAREQPASKCRECWQALPSYGAHDCPKARLAESAPLTGPIVCWQCYGRFKNEHALARHAEACDGRRDASIAAASASGMSIREVALALGLSKEIVWRVLDRRREYDTA